MALTLGKYIAMATATLYRWDNLTTDYPMTHLERQRVIGEKMMISRVTLHPGCKVPSHSHANEQITHVVSGCLVLYVGDPPERVEVKPGEVIILPPHLPHGAEVFEQTVVLDLFAPPSQTTGIDQPKS